MTERKRAAFYIRVSSTEQAEEGLSIPAQQRLLRKYAEDNGFSVDEDAIFVDAGESARTDRRPEFQRMIALAKQRPRPWDAILVHKMDRFARNRTDSVVYKSLLRHECNIDVLSITETFGDDPVGRLMEGIMESIAEFYSANLALEVRKGKREGALKTLVLGEPPFGYKIGADGTHEIDDDEAAIIRFIYDAYIHQGKSLRAIGIYLRSEEALDRFGLAVRMKRAKGLQGGRHNDRPMVWRPGSIKRYLQNPAYRGEYIYTTDEGETITGCMPRIISNETYEMAQMTLAHRKRERSPSNDYLLRGLVRCGYCGGGMSQLRQTWTTASKEKRITHSLRCTEHVQLGICQPNLIRMHVVEEAVFRFLESASRELDPQSLSIAPLKRSDSAKERASIERKLKELPLQFDRQMAAYQAGVIDLDQLKLYRDQLDQQKSALQSAQRELNDRIHNANIDIELMKEKLAAAVLVISNPDLPLQERKNALLSIVDHIDVLANEGKVSVTFRSIS